MLLTYLLAFVALGELGYGQYAPGPRSIKHGMFPAQPALHDGGQIPKAPISRRQAPNPTRCGAGSQITAKAPKSNIFAGLTDDETAAVIAFLHEQDSLNLTAGSNTTG